MVTVELPFPPTVNSYWRRNGNRYFICAKGKQFRNDVIILCNKIRNKFHTNDRLSLTIQVYPPDKRRRDLDNLVKAVQDSLQHAGVYHDDCQIDELHIVRCTPLTGKVIIQLKVF